VRTLVLSWMRTKVLTTNQSEYDSLSENDVAGESGMAFVGVGVFGRTLSNMAI
jgi:hypothetical protein